VIASIDNCRFIRSTPAKQFVCFAHLSTFAAIAFSIKIPRVFEAKRRDLVAHAQSRVIIERHTVVGPFEIVS
jgi:hypothetical protein